jgi:hypothetical protein
MAYLPCALTLPYTWHGVGLFENRDLVRKSSSTPRFSVPRHAMSQIGIWKINAVRKVTVLLDGRAGCPLRRRGMIDIFCGARGIPCSTTRLPRSIFIQKCTLRHLHCQLQGTIHCIYTSNLSSKTQLLAHPAARQVFSQCTSSGPKADLKTLKYDH